MKLYILFGTALSAILFVLPSANSEEVRNYAVLDMSLDMTFNEVKKIHPSLMISKRKRNISQKSSNFNVKYVIASNNINGWKVSGEFTPPEMGSRLVYLKISRHLGNDADFDSIVLKLYEKYGEPNIDHSSYNVYRNIYWGNCRRELITKCSGDYLQAHILFADGGFYITLKRKENGIDEYHKKKKREMETKQSKDVVF